jgi:transposase
LYREFIIDLIKLPDFDLVQMTRRSVGWTAILEPKDRCFLCPKCGGSSTAHKRGHRRVLRHRIVPSFGFIHVEVPVYHQQCCRCLYIWSVQWDGIPQHGKGTTLYKEALMTLCDESSIQSVSTSFDVPYSTLERWYYEWAEQQNDRFHRHRQDPTVICLDDFALQKGHRYAISLVDHDSGEVCHMEKGRSRSSIQRALKRWPYNKPEVVVTDLAPGMAKTIKEVWPDTQVAADPFHVVQLFTKELDNHRKKLSKKEKSQSKRRQLTKLLTTPPRNLTFKELFRVEDWLAQNKELEILYQSLQGIRRIYAQPDVSLAEKALDGWVEHYLFSENRTVHRIAKTIQQWKHQVINAIRYKVSNGTIEGINNKIKLIKRRAYGYRNMRHFELRVNLETASVA